MGRRAREISETRLYHIVFRGINKQHIFEESVDYNKMKSILKEIKEEMKFEIYVYCFMTNHVHILLKESKRGDISLIMKRLLTKYARYYNRKYKRSGALIANRYKSQPVDVDEYFLAVVRYIHQNPVKAKMVNKIEEYSWSSYCEYLFDKSGLADKEFVTKMLTKEEFEEFHQFEEENIFTVDDKIKVSDEGIRRDIIKRYGYEPSAIGSLKQSERNVIISGLRQKYSIRQIERVTGISRGIVANVDK